MNKEAFNLGFTLGLIECAQKEQAMALQKRAQAIPLSGVPGMEGPGEYASPMEGRFEDPGSVAPEGGGINPYLMGGLGGGALGAGIGALLAKNRLAGAGIGAGLGAGVGLGGAGLADYLGGDELAGNPEMEALVAAGMDPALLQNASTEDITSMYKLLMTGG